MFQELFKMQEEVFRTIASQKRLEIIQLLFERELMVSEITEMLGIKQANVSQHLGALRKAKIVQTRRVGTTVYYHLADDRIAKACDLVKSFLKDQYNLTSDMEKMLQDQEHIFPVAIDPVCGMRVSVSYAGGAAEHTGHTFYFCASGCQQKFEEQPTNYVDEAGQIHG
ncbi:MAG: metalloregulator ArsR/SmtB family transcription factor [Micrococcaceae bacterium]